MSPTSNPLSSPSSVAWADPVRQSLFDVWLRQTASAYQLQPSSVRIASADASFRRYLRVDTLAGDSRIIMDAPPDKENCQPFVHVAGLMQGAGLHAPEVLDWQQDHGFMLLTDLGDQTMMSAIQPEVPQANQALYLQAVDALIQWQLASRPGQLPPYDLALLNREISLFPDWYLGQHKGVQLQGQDKETVDKAFALIVQRNLAAP
ncbi:MAG: aminoglycoside phosphotransferase family protein, partial [Limnohabitans sp.]